MDFREISWWSVDWIQLAQDRDRWRALVNTVMNFRLLAPRSFFPPEGGVGQTQAWMPAFMLAYYAFPR
jgi:hypothetical protein